MPSKTIAFLGASTGVGLSALKHALADGHRCIALCRDPSKLTNNDSIKTSANLTVIKGNAHDQTSVSQCLTTPEGRLVDEIVSTIGGKFIASKFTIDDPNVCEKGMDCLIASINDLRRQGITGDPHIVVFSTTGMSRFGRDTPIAMVPLYYILLKVPHADKGAMETKLAQSGEQFTIVRGSWLGDGETDNTIRVGIEDPTHGVESKAIGYSITREDAGKWIAQNLLSNRSSKFDKKTVTITN